VYFPRAILERGGGVVESGSAGAEYRNAFAAQRVEVDGGTRVRVEALGNGATDEARNLPVSGAFDAGGEHDPTCVEHARGAGARSGHFEGTLTFVVVKRADLGIRLYGDCQSSAIPAQILGPGLPGDQAERLEAAAAVLGVVPCARREAGDA
jgi:hypothetical protein